MAKRTLGKCPKTQQQIYPNSEWDDYSRLEVIIQPEERQNEFVYEITKWDGDFNSAISLALDAYEEARSLMDNPEGFDHILLTPLK